MDIFASAAVLKKDGEKGKARRRKARAAKKSFIVRRAGEVVKSVAVEPKPVKEKKKKARSGEYIAPFDRNVWNLPEEWVENAPLKPTEEHLRRWLGKATYARRADLIKVVERYPFMDREEVVTFSVNRLLMEVDMYRKEQAKSLRIQEVSEFGTEERLGKFAGSFEVVYSVHSKVGDESEEEMDLIHIGSDE